MKWLNNLSFTSRIGVAMLFSFALNFGIGNYTKNQLSDSSYKLDLDVNYDNEGTIELLFDTGNNFNTSQKITKKLLKGQNVVQFTFGIEKKEQLKFLRLDFGNDTLVKEVRITAMALSRKNKELFSFKENDVLANIGMLRGVSLAKDSKCFIPKISQKSFDPYVVFSPVNELMYPLWQRTLLLITPWFLIFILPILRWIKERFAQKEFSLLLVALFLIAIPLKMAWVTFTSLLLTLYALIYLIKQRKLKFSGHRLAVCGLFIMPVLFLGNGAVAKLSIQLGFVIFSLVFSILDFSLNYNTIKLIYIKVFFVLTSVIIVSWLLFTLQSGYFYGIDLGNYLSNIKSNAHLVINWLYYSHTTFLSFFIIIGIIFSFDLLKKKAVTIVFVTTFAFLAIGTLLILGSRFAWFLALILPILNLMSIVTLKRILLPLWAAIFAAVVYSIEKVDTLRYELWKTSYAQIKENSWFGQGTGSSENILPNQFPIDKNGVTAMIDINHSHNQFLTYLLENGILGTLIFIGLMFYLWRSFVKANNKTMLLILFSMLLLMIVESPFKTNTPLYLFSFLLCCFSSRLEKNGENLISK